MVIPFLFRQAGAYRLHTGSYLSLPGGRLHRTLPYISHSVASIILSSSLTDADDETTKPATLSEPATQYKTLYSRVIRHVIFSAAVTD